MSLRIDGQDWPPGELQARFDAAVQQITSAVKTLPIWQMDAVAGVLVALYGTDAERQLCLLAVALNDIRESDAIDRQLDDDTAADFERLVLDELDDLDECDDPEAP